jgi:flagellar hook assembly protein FlgD
MRNKYIDPMKLTILKHAILFPVFFLSAALFVFSFSPTVVWSATPTAPTNLTAMAASSKQINLSWQDNATNEANYYVERAPASTGTWQVIATLGANVTSYQNTVLTQNMTYYYRVRCKAGNTYSSYSNTANAITATLAAPTGLTAGVISSSSISLAWADNSAYESNYSVERSPDGSSSWTVIATLGANVTTYTNTGLTVGTAYYYRVRAYDGTNYSAYSSVVNQTIRTIAASAGANGAISPIGTVGVASGSTQVFTITPNTGYKIDTVTVDGGAVATNPTYTFSNVTVNHTISAAFSVNTFTITASAGANGSISPSGIVSVNSGATSTFTMTPNTGYHVSDVLVDGASVGAVGSYTFTNVTANHTIAASFAINTYTITASAGANGTISPSGVVSVNSGATTTFTITPNSGYHVSDVLVDGVSQGAITSYPFTNVTANHTIIASFAINTYTITASAGANGTISPSGIVSVNSGATATFTMTPNTSYHVSDVLVDILSAGAVTSYTFNNVITNHTISAVYSVNSTTTTVNGGIIPSDTTWTLAGSPYIVTSTVSVYGTPTTPVTLTIEPGVVIKFNSGAGLQIGSSTNQGALVARGTATNHITFTGNGTGIIWAGITFNNGTVDSATILENADVQYNYGIQMNSASPTMKNSSVTNVTGWGMYLISSNPVLDNVTISNSGGAFGIYLSSSSPTITGGSLTNSTPAGSGISGSGSPIISNYTISVVNATGNFGINLSSGSTSTLSITNSSIGNGLYLGTTGITPTITGNTFTNYDNSPLRAGAMIVNNILDNNTFTGMTSASRIEVLGEQVTQDTRWKKWMVPYVVISGTIAVYKDTTTSVTLTIDPGVLVKFISGAIQIGYNTNLGALVARGTAADHITFTRNGTSGNWSTMTFNDGTIDSTTVLEYVDIQYSNGITMNSASPTIRNSTITDVANGYYGLYLNSSNPTIDTVAITSNGYGIYLGSSSPIITGGSLTTSHSVPGAIYGSGSPIISNYSISTENSAGAYGVNIITTTPSLSITNSTISNGLFIGSTGIIPTITGNTFTNSDTSPLHAGANIIAQILDNNTFTGMTSAGRIEVAGEVINRVTRWKQWAAPYVVSGWVSVYKDATNASTLTIDPGVIVKFTQGGMQIGGSTMKGVLIAKGTVGSKILFTSSQTTPTAGYWGGITFSGDAASSSTLEQATIEYAGSGGAYYSANIILNSSSPVIRNSIIRNSSQSGIYANSAQSWPVIIDSEVTGNKWGIYSFSSNPYITNTKITGNTTAGVWNASTTMDVDARDNWWGVASGPTYTGNPNGAGDKISDHVLYNPWLGQSPGTTLSITNAKVLPASINPNGDYVTFTATISSSASWTITITDTNSVMVKTFSGAGASINQKWYGDDSQSVTVADGVYYYKLDAADAEGNTASSPQGLIMVSRQLPVAIMDPPSDNQMFRCGSTINIMGTASDATSFKNYTIDYGAGENPSSWANLKTSTTATTNGLLYAWNTSSLTGYTYTVRLTVTNNSNNVASETSMVRFLCIQNVALSETYISPNGDRVKDTTTISATFTQPSDWTLAIKDPSGSAVRTFTGSATSISQTWDGRDNNGAIVSDGSYTYQLDAIGTGTTTTASPKTGPIVVDAVISNVGITSNTINTQAAETTTVFFSLTSQATVTFSIIPEKQGSNGSPVYQTGKVCPAGACSFTWDGKDNTGKVVPDEAYLFVLTVSNGAHTGGYSPVALTGTGTVSCTQSSGFDPISNQPMTITYSPAQPSRVSINISWGSQNFKILDSFPILSGSNDLVWDGRNQSNKPLDFGAKAICTVASLLRENVILTTGDTVRTSALKTDPYMLNLAYGQFTRITFTLSRDANVTVKLTSPSGAVLTVLNNQLQTAGPQEVDWNGLDPADVTAKNELVSEEGDYMVTVQAVNPATGTSSITKANARIGY